MASYQLNYGSQPAQETSSQPPPQVDTDPEAYWKYYYGDKPPDVSDPNYAAWYSYYYGATQAASDGPDISDPAYPKWYYKQCYGVEPDEENEDYKKWVSQLQDSQVDNANTTSGDTDAKVDEAKEESTAEDNEKDGDSKTDAGVKEPAAKKKKPEPSK